MVERPTYKPSPYESPARLPGLPTSVAGNGASVTAAAPPTPHLIHGIEEGGPRADLTDSLVTAAATVYKALTAQIAWHREQLKQLEAALVPFAKLSGGPPQEPNISGDAVKTLLDIASKMEAGQ